ncbi:MAG: type II toxin-antitoxin system VapC family toxin [Armatimonadota bacterium]|nr:type II toxin-antitoxin system VapC family toxin [Armatimonadota bacterium]
MNIVFDASALIAFLRLEPGAAAVRQLLRTNRGDCYAHAINLCEVYYDFYRSDGEAVAQRALQLIASVGITTREDMDNAFWQDAGRLKAAHRISLADAFCLALARRISGEVVTTDHHEFDPLVPLGICPIRFIR